MKVTCLAFIIWLLPNLVLAATSPAVTLYQAVSSKVYTIYGSDDRETDPAIGSAVSVSENLLATSCHVGFAKLNFKVKIGDKKYPCQVMCANEKRDLCLLAVANQQFKPVDMVPSKSVVIGEDVYAIANPYGLEKSITRGMISNKRQAGSGWLLQTDATLEHGSSGGGLFNTDGKLVGIIYAGHRFKNIGFIIPVEWIQEGIAKANAPID